MEIYRMWNATGTLRKPNPVHVISIEINSPKYLRVLKMIMLRIIM